ncbi:MAG: response regulator [Paludibacteraceae bacterium]|nr:response regulator [Paludibacteraceae bacterium]
MRRARYILLLLLWAMTLPAEVHYVIRHYSVEDGLSQNTVNTILQDSIGYMWFGTWAGLNRFDGYTFTTYQPSSPDPNSAHDGRIINLWEEQGQLIIQTYDNTCYTLTDGKMIPTGRKGPPLTLETDSIYIDRHDIVWAIDDQPGISRYRNGQWKRFTPALDPRYEGQLRRNFLMLEDKDGNLWVNPTGGGFSRYNYERDELEWPFGHIVNGRMEGVTNMIHTAYIDRQGILWLSTYDKGIDRIDLNPQPFDLVDMRTTDDPSGEVRAFLVKDGQLTTYVKDRRRIYCATRTSRGLLLGTKGRGVIGTPTPCGQADVYAILEADGHLFIGTYDDGIWDITDNAQRHLFPHLKVRDLLYTRRTLIAATTDGLLIGDSLLPYHDVRCLAIDRSGQVWAGTFGGGLLRVDIDQPGLTTVPIEHDIILALAVDHDGDLWMTGEKGIVRYNPRSNTHQHYDVLTGDRDAYFTEAKAVRIGDDIAFGYNHGYCRFTPDQITRSSYIPPIVITGIDRPNPKAVTIRFAALDYVAPEKIQYRYRMSGADKEWRSDGTRHEVSYTNLGAGKYIFQIAGTNSEGEWSSQVLSYPITIRRPAWQSWYVVLIVLFVLSLLAVLAVHAFNTASALRQEVAVEQKVTDIKLRFFTNISHELRTPLTLISGPVDNILHTERLSGSVREQLEIVSSNSKRMLRLVNELLDFRKLQQHQLRLKIQSTRMSELIEQTAAHFNKEAADKHITYTWDLQAADAVAWVDRDKTDIILFNLLSNAFKYTPAGGSITIRLTEKEEFVVISVQDTGPGIPKDKRSILFTRFQSHNELRNTGNQPGTGIGLNLTKELVDLHKGYIEVESEVGRGSTFIVMLRKGHEHFGNEVDMIVDDSIRKDTAIEPLPDLNTISVDDAKKLIVVVDDSEDMRLFMQNIFADSYRIVTAEDGVQALDIIQNQGPDLVITDLMMPNMDGLELTQRIKQDENLAHIPVILLTAKTAIESQLEGLDKGADDYITKPFSPEYMTARVRNLLAQREQLRELYRSQLLKMDINKVQQSPDEIFLAQLLNFMEKEMDNNCLTVDDLVSHMALGRTVFFNRLKGLTGLSPVEFIREVRIKRAAQLLEMQQYNVTEVTYMIGMNDSRYFSKCFKQMMGVTPTEYKRLHSK